MDHSNQGQPFRPSGNFPQAPNMGYYYPQGVVIQGAPMNMMYTTQPMNLMYVPTRFPSMGQEYNQANGSRTPNESNPFAKMNAANFKEFTPGATNISGETTTEAPITKPDTTPIVVTDRQNSRTFERAEPATQQPGRNVHNDQPRNRHQQRTSTQQQTQRPGATNQLQQRNSQQGLSRAASQGHAKPSQQHNQNQQPAPRQAAQQQSPATRPSRTIGASPEVQPAKQSPAAAKPAVQQQQPSKTQPPLRQKSSTSSYSSQSSSQTSSGAPVTQTGPSRAANAPSSQAGSSAPATQGPASAPVTQTAPSAPSASSTQSVSSVASSQSSSHPSGDSTTSSRVRSRHSSIHKVENANVVKPVPYHENRVYSPEELRQIGEQVTDEKMSKYELQYEEQKNKDDAESFKIVVHTFSWNVSFLSKDTAHGLLGEVRANLNKLTLENFKQIYDVIVKHKPQDLKMYRDIIDLIYDKAITEQYFASMYARLCMKLNRDYQNPLRSMLYAKETEGGFTCCENGTENPLCEPQPTKEEAIERTMKMYSVRSLLAARCHKEMVAEGQTVELEKKRLELKAMMQTKEDPKIMAEFMDVEFKINKIRRDIFGNVRFIGELFNCGLLRMLSVIKSCFDHLITPPESADDEKTEALCKLLTTVGKTMCNNMRFSELLEETMLKIEPLAESHSLTIRVRFAVRDLLDLAAKDWEDDKSEKLKKLSDMRMESTIKKLESIVEMLEKPKRGNSQRRAPVESVMEKMTKQETYDGFTSSIKNGMSEAKASRDAEDFWYNVEEKMKNMKCSESCMCSCVFLYMCEQMMPDTPEFKSILDYITFGINEKKVKEDDVSQGIFASLHVLDMMDVPKRYLVAKEVIRILSSQKVLDGDKMIAKLKEALNDNNVAFSAKQIIG